MKSRPIIMRAEEVRVILDGRKTQFRRPIKPQPVLTVFPSPCWWEHTRKPWMPIGGVHQDRWKCPHGQPGDRLWVRETWRCRGGREYEYQQHQASIVYRADVEPVESSCNEWRPSIHMPRWASRITLEIVRVRVERVGDITEEDAKSEGIKIGEDRSHSFAEHGLPYHPHADAFGNLWQSTHGTWNANPWVWVVEFRRIDK